jgi:hypothetical protein
MTFRWPGKKQLSYGNNNMKIEDIARQLNVTDKAVERSITSAYKRFRKQGAFIYNAR